jgi:hypothetical protein
MTSEIITRFVEGRPFERFELITADGRLIKIPHSDYALLERYAAALVVYSDDGHAEFIDTDLIVSIRTLDPLSDAAPTQE